MLYYGRILAPDWLLCVVTGTVRRRRYGEKKIRRGGIGLAEQPICACAVCVPEISEGKSGKVLNISTAISERSS